MLFIRSAILLVALLTINKEAFSQARTRSWIEMLDDPKVTLAEFKEAGKAHFELFGVGKGSGYKQFKRIEYFLSRRIQHDQKLSALQNYAKEIQAYKESHAGLRMTSTNGDWTLLGPTEMPTNGTTQPNGLGRVNVIAEHPADTATLYVGAPSGGFWKTTDHGVTWEDLSSGFTELGVSSIVIHPTDHDTIYVGTGDRDGSDVPGYGVWRSTDGGQTWASRNSGMGNRYVHVLLIHPDSPDTLIAATNGARLYRSTDAGANWSFSTTGSTIKDMQFKPGDPDIMYGGGYITSSQVTFSRSTNNGASWSTVSSGLPSSGMYRMAIAVSEDEPTWVYVMAGGPSGLVGIYRSTNSGVSFSTRMTSPNILGWNSDASDVGGQTWYDHVLVADPNDASTVYAGGINIWKSTNGGTSFSLSAHWTGSGGGDDVHADHHYFLYSQSTNVLYNGNDGGVYYTTDGGTDWIEISSGLSISQLYKVGQAQTRRDLIISGYQDNGTSVMDHSGFTTEIGGDGMECLIDPGDDDYMYGALYNGIIRRSDDGGLSFTTIGEDGSNGINEEGDWVTPYKLDPGNTGRMYAGYKNIWRTTNVKAVSAASVSWTKISSLSTSEEVVDLAIAISDNDVLYFSRTDGSFYRSNNASTGSPSWTTLTGSLPVASVVKDIEIDPADDTHLWIAQGNSIYESTNSGSSWTDYSGSLPNISLNCIVYDTLSSNDALYVGMDYGVYYRDDGTGDWVSFSTNLPNVEITELEIFYDTQCGGESRLTAATYGRGAWVSDLRDPGTIAPTACFETNITEACLGQSIQLQDLSVYPTGWSWSISPSGNHSFVGGTSATDQNPSIQFSSIGTYSITLNVTNGNGSDNLTKSNLITVSNASSTPITEDFESESNCATTQDCEATTCNLSGSWSNGVNGTEDDIDWRVHNGSTGSSNTGPTQDANPGNASGKYVYLEASSCSGQFAFLYSPCIDLNGRANIELSYQYHMYGEFMGELRVDVLGDNGWTLNVAEPVVGDQGNTWYSNTVNLDQFADQVIQIRFRGATGMSFTSDLALDDIGITSVSALPVLDWKAGAENRNNEAVRLWWDIKRDQVDLPMNLVIKGLEGSEFEEIENGELRTENDLQSEFLDFNYGNGLNYYVIELRGEKQELLDQKILEAVMEVQDDLQIYPNPADDVLNIRLGSWIENREVPLLLLDRLGKVVLERVVKRQGESSIYSLNIEGIEPGMYFVMVEGVVKKVIVNSN